MKSPSVHNPVTLHSLNVLLLAAILVQFSLIGVKAMFMAFSSIPFTWQPLSLADVSSNIVLWGFGRLYFVYGGTPLLFFIIGLLLSYFLHANHSLKWRARLLLTWISFFLVNTFLAGMIASLFVFDGIGVVFIWMFPNFILRLFIGLVASAAMMFSRPYWEHLFYKAIYSKSILRDRKSKQQFLRQTFVLPYLISVPVLILFSILSSQWYWSLSIISMGLVIYGFKILKPKTPRIRILKDSTHQSNYIQPILFCISLLLVLYISSSITLVIN